jgi:hypothetical protein
MSAQGNLSTPQFGSVQDGTYDVAAHGAWHREHFSPVRAEQRATLSRRVRDSVQASASARARGDRKGATKALNDAARHRRIYQDWSPHLRP